MASMSIQNTARWQKIVCAKRATTCFRLQIWSLFIPLGRVRRKPPWERSDLNTFQEQGRVLSSTVQWCGRDFHPDQRQVACQEGTPDSTLKTLLHLKKSYRLILRDHIDIRSSRTSPPKGEPWRTCRRSIRLKDYDYSYPCGYFITVCVRIRGDS